MTHDAEHAFDLAIPVLVPRSVVHRDARLLCGKLVGEPRYFAFFDDGSATRQLASYPLFTAQDLMLDFARNVWTNQHYSVTVSLMDALTEFLHLRDNLGRHFEATVINPNHETESILTRVLVERLLATESTDR